MVSIADTKSSRFVMNRRDPTLANETFPPCLICWMPHWWPIGGRMVLSCLTGHRERNWMTQQAPAGVIFVTRGLPRTPCEGPSFLVVTDGDHQLPPMVTVGPVAQGGGSLGQSRARLGMGATYTSHFLHMVKSKRLGAYLTVWTLPGRQRAPHAEQGRRCPQPAVNISTNMITMLRPPGQGIERLVWAT